MVKNILIVDDDEDDCDLFCDALKMVDDNIAFQKVSNGRKALALLQSDCRPDFIFLDLNMPIMDGKKCLMEMRKIKSLDSVPIIIYTTSKRKDDMDNTKSTGADYFMTKPSSLTELCAEISFVLLKNWSGAHAVDHLP